MTIRRVAYAVNVFPKISETFILNEVVELRRRGIEVLVLSLRRPEEPFHHPAVDEYDLLESVEYEPERFEARARAFSPDVVHAHFATRPAETARAIAGHLAVPFSFTAHGYDVFSRPPADFSDRAAAAGAVVTVSHANASHIAAAFGVDRASIDVIPCGVDTDLFTPVEAPDSGAVAVPLVLCVARLHPAKNLPLLLAAAGRLRDDGIAFRAAIVGDGKGRAEVEEARRRIGVENLVDLAGLATQDGVRSWWRRASVGVLSSDREGFPVSLMEAAACGVPVVATRVGGVAELVADGVTGILVAPDDLEAMTAGLRRLLADRDLRRAMGQAARQRAEQRFSLRAQVDRLIECWDRMLAR